MLRLTRVLTWLTLCAAVATPTSVGAQRLDKETQQSPPPGWVFTPAFGFGVAWDDNILLAGRGSDTLEDYASPLDPNVTLDYRGRKLSLTSGYGGSFFMYRTFDELNSSNQRVRVEMRHRTTARLTLFAREQFIEAPTTDTLSLTGVPFQWAGSRTNEAGGGFEAAVARHTSLIGSYVLRSVTFDELAGQQLQDGDEHVGTLTLTRAISPRLVLGGAYELRREIVSQTELVAEDRFNIQSGGFTAEYKLTPTITVSGLFGIAHLGAGLTHDARTGPSIRAGVDYRARDTTLSAAYLRNFVPSFGFGGTYQNEEWTATARVPLSAISRRLYVSSSLAWSDNDALEIGQPSLQSLWFSGTLGYLVSRWLSVEGYGNRTQQDTQRAGGDLRRNQIGFRVVVSKPMRIR
jgi:hypothetical protein